MTAIFKCTIPNRCPVKKNTQRVIRNHGHIRVIYSPQFREWEQAAIAHLKQSFISREMITTPIEVRLKFFFKNRSGEADLSNLLEGPNDVMTKAGVIEDDRLIQVIHATKHFGEEPRVEIELHALEVSECA